MNANIRDWEIEVNEDGICLEHEEFFFIANRIGANRIATDETGAKSVRIPREVIEMAKSMESSYK